ncbi:MAG: alpha/beta fold hydrolase [Thermonemataceae bacterium]
MKIKVAQGLLIRHNEIDNAKPSIWFLHGFADSGLAYKEVFESPINESTNIYVVDLPGFGASPLNPAFLSIREQADLITKIIEQETDPQQKVNIVAHSLAALIGTWICQHLKEKINYYFNIEGNLTEADSYFSSKPLAFNTAQEFAVSFEQEIFELAQSEERYRRYYSSVRLANPEGMRNWSLTSQAYVKENKCGVAFKHLACQCLYIWGDIDTPLETQAFIKEQGIPNQLYKGIGHWHMVENAEELYSDINERIKTE